MSETWFRDSHGFDSGPSRLIESDLIVCRCPHAGVLTTKALSLVALSSSAVSPFVVAGSTFAGFPQIKAC